MPSMLSHLYKSEKREISAQHLEADTSADAHCLDKEFSVHWVAHRRETQPVAIERTALQGLDKLVETCQGRFSEMRRTYPGLPPDGFLVFDNDGNEVRRWFETVRPKE
jgi:ribose 1,5-bisphosphokinase PhnN